VFHTRTWRTGSVPGVASVDGRRLACDHRLVAASHRAFDSFPFPRAHRARQSERRQPNRERTARSSERLAQLPNRGRLAAPPARGNWSSPETVRHPLQPARRPPRNRRCFPGEAEMAEAAVNRSRSRSGMFMIDHCLSRSAPVRWVESQSPPTTFQTPGDTSRTIPPKRLHPAAFLARVPFAGCVWLVRAGSATRPRVRHCGHMASCYNAFWLELL
jgi:hypothetical protein